MEITELSPKIVWKYFHEITQVPRPSKKEGKIIAYLEKFAKEHNIAYKKDHVGNIVMTKPATPGYEDRVKVILQSHVDMVCEKNADTKHDFDNDPIRTIVDGEWLHADGTTLGADNGIGCAAQLAILASNDIPHGPLEALFTIDEETGMTGAMELKPGFLEGKILINLDSEDEGELFIGCAGGMGIIAEFKYNAVDAPKDLVWLRASVAGLKGGHSGGEIHCGLGNANKILTRFLYALDKSTTWSLAEISGGNLHNAIPREAHAVFGVKAADKAKVEALIKQLDADVRNEQKAVDPNVRVSLGEATAPSKVIDEKTKHALVRALYACPHGVLGMSHEIADLVETSNNLASIKQRDGVILVETSQRSSTTSLRNSASEMVSSVFELAGASVSVRDPYPGWKPNPDSAILKASADSYRKLFGKEPAVKAIHAGLECGLILDVYPDLDMVSFGPTLRDVHSPAERIEIKTVDLWWKHLLEVLKEIPSAKK
ncbi:Xaa-His dipeptidase [Porphyromonas catoniae F0037]|uniref:Cytosol non-specific dipeptidase n=1 Tax=Porphyromonas catoniae F0037 TaxID=1127696 RepID=L1N9A3_9PORP|nr:aminoacyl-histidine dipeptidase [Porphyromonas catoniae]EKX99905.1 Xaa-His dipeptidase [Porphyromonas catoniae F0037]